MGHLATPPKSRVSRAWWWLVPFLVFCGLAEFGYSFLYVNGAIFPPRRVAIFEESQGTLLFDPVLGLRLTQTPARCAVFTDGRLETAGTFAGNAQGFSDRRDFTPARLPGEALRLGVFGDSFSALVSLDRTWPEWVEDEYAKSGPGARLMNFSVSGAGLANWWSVMHRLVMAQSYELDGVVFAVFEASSALELGDLDRNFSMSDHSTGAVLGGRASNWSPGTWPQTFDAARPMMRTTDRRVLSRDAFERVLRGDAQPGLPRPWDAYLFRSLLHGRLSPPPVDMGSPVRLEVLNAGQRRLVEEIARTCAAHRWPVLVFRIAGRDDLVARTAPSDKLMEFSRLLGAHFIDGAAAFEGRSEAEIRADWYPVDGHWDQPGSDRFARFAADQIAAWRASWTLTPAAAPPTP